MLEDAQHVEKDLLCELVSLLDPSGEVISNAPYRPLETLDQSLPGMFISLEATTRKLLIPLQAALLPPRSVLTA
jgi:hypothetical protein